MRAVAWLLIALVGCKDKAGAPPAAADAAVALAEPLPPPLAELGTLARPTDVTAAATVAGEKGGAVPLGDGAMLVVAPGAYSGAVAIGLRRVELDLGKLRSDVKGGVAYVVSTDRDIDKFGAPVTLQVKRPEGPFGAVIRQDGAWKPVAVGDGPLVAVALPHFSRGILGFIEWLKARTNATNEAILDGDSMEARKRGKLLGEGNDAAKTFYGVGDKLDQVTPKQLCGELMRLVQDLPKAAYAYPPESRFRNIDLGLWLIDGRIPSTTEDPMWKLTEAFMEPIRGAVLAAPGRLSPAETMKICLDKTDGNVPMAVMACHNFLKEVTYAGRNQPIDRMAEGYGAVAAKLMPLRTDDVAPSGYYDKMGPIYHVFAAMAATTWSAASPLGNMAAGGEAILRIAQRGGDKPDPEKASADDCGVDVGWAINRRERSDWRGTIPPPPPVTWKVDSPPEPPPPPAPAAVRDAGTADGVAAVDGGASPESMLAQLDAGPAPADEKKGWNGKWRGQAKTAVNMGDTATTVTESLELTAADNGDTVNLKRDMGNRTLAMDLKKTPSNPNAAVGQGDQNSSLVGYDTKLHWHMAAFLHTDGRMYVACRLDSTTTGQGPDGKPMTVNMKMEFIAILSR